MCRLFLIIPFLLIVAPFCYGHEADSQGQLLIRKYLESTHADEMENILHELNGLHISLNTGKEWIKTSASYTSQPLGLQRKLVPIGEKHGEYFVYTPSHYVPDKSWPMILILHGVGSRGYDPVMAWLRSSAHNDEFILVAPTYGHGLWWKDEAERLILSVFDKMKQEYNIDTDRVYLTGFSSGGHGAWYMALRYPHFFAAISPIAGECPIPSFLVNLMHVPVYIVHGAQDTVIPAEAARDALSRLEKLNYRVAYKELPEMKHRFPLDETGEILDWFRANGRLLYPKKLRFSTESIKYSVSYWVEILEFSEIVGRVSGVQKDISGHLMRSEALPVTASVEADIKDENNEIFLVTQGIKAIRLYLENRLIDMERPLRVYINGKMVYSEKVNENVRVILDTVKKRNDRKALFSAYLDLKVPFE
ncbi:MAG: hypothetical protein DWB56_02240 [Candidatus Jettenia sp.]|nr:dienelactone hydrolase family protein [Candidatus Jettenia sp. AMX1]MBC6927776.1 hypothetical protein [Candidatus Jettenia sp.]GIL21091.1 MAG: hypothetical protein BroJett041_22050 [Candidatus Jettenia caeni]KAA0250310.1 MAG: hypothetical protein EDM77_05760 [Candidatus Jettenia sp. AMX1]MCE7879481.1 hypothetical protein [Candidatus Jettenia sp. AMX1]MCQ3926097.1 hypothetical protein [Candidatus Jettenia sp.]